MPPAEISTALTPLAPSVEKAYYRKCIELKRRLNEVEAANDEAKIRRVRLDRGIMKMRLERAFLLDELRKRMDYTDEASEGSGDEEGATTPPPDRPHRDKRRRQDSAPANAAPAASSKATTSRNAQTPSSRLATQAESVAPADALATTESRPRSGQDITHPSESSAPKKQVDDSSPSRPPSGIPLDMNGMDTDGPTEREREAPVNRDAGATGEALTAGPTIREDSNGERRVLSPSTGENALP